MTIHTYMVQKQIGLSEKGKRNSLSPFAPESLVPRDKFDRLRPASARPFSIHGLNLVLTHELTHDFLSFLPLSAMTSTHIVHRNGVSPEFIGSTQSRTDGVHRQEYAGTGPVVLRVVRVTSVASASP